MLKTDCIRMQVNTLKRALILQPWNNMADWNTNWQLQTGQLVTAKSCSISTVTCLFYKKTKNKNKLREKKRSFNQTILYHFTLQRFSCWNFFLLSEIWEIRKLRLMVKISGNFYINCINLFCNVQLLTEW